MYHRDNEHALLVRQVMKGVDSVQKYKFLFSMKPSTGSDISDENYEEQTDRCIYSWLAACEVLNAKQYSHEGLEFCLEADWSPVVESFRRHKKAMSVFRRRVEKYTRMKELNKINDLRDPFQRRNTKITIDVTVTEYKNIEEIYCRSNSKGVVLSYLFDVFLIMGISSPGSCNFHRAKLNCIEPKTTYKENVDNIPLSDYVFDFWQIDSDGSSFADAKFLDVKKVARWFYFHRNGLSQTPESRIQKSLFSIWIIANLDMPENRIIWMFYALETLFGTEPGKNRSELIARISRLLKLEKSQIKTLKRKLDSLYKIRSSIAHGGLAIRHPMQHFGLDNRVDDKYGELLSEADFGFRLLGSSLQQIAERQLRSIEFVEEMQLREQQIEF